MLIATLIKSILLSSIATVAAMPSELPASVPDDGAHGNATMIPDPRDFRKEGPGRMRWPDWSFQASRFCQTRLEGEYGYRPWHQNHVAVYVRDWQNIPSGVCGKGFLDNLRGQCRCRVAHWHCQRRVSPNGEHGFFARFTLVRVEPWYTKGAVENAFVIASAAEKEAPKTLMCCFTGDRPCLMRAPGYEGGLGPPESSEDTITDYAASGGLAPLASDE